jgi:hypothetical protein
MKYKVLIVLDGETPESKEVVEAKVRALLKHGTALPPSPAPLSVTSFEEAGLEVSNLDVLDVGIDEGGLVHVEFYWSDAFGECYDCGRPAAFVSSEHNSDPENKRCAVCAANDASGGATIQRIDAITEVEL